MNHIIYIYQQNKWEPQQVLCKESETIQQAMTRSGIYNSAPCGGRGTCGKCAIQVREGQLAITSFDEGIFTKEELNKGYRLACKSYPKEECSVVVLQREESDFVMREVKNQHQNQNVPKENNCVLAIDLGSTTIAISLLAVREGVVIDTYTTLNHQRAYGADVVSRIQMANEGKGKLLQEVVRGDLLQGLQALLERNGIGQEDLVQITVAANTTMGHLLMGFPCEGLGTYPFAPHTLALLEQSVKEVFGIEAYPNAKVVVLPGISTYVGADILAGIYEYKIHKSRHFQLLVDLGTNGELVLGNQDKCYVASTAMGPACEGGNITCGMGSVPGAITSVTIQNGTTLVETIGNQQPVGICGTGVFEVVAELWKNGYVDETGLLQEAYFEQGWLLAQNAHGEEIRFTQQDIRAIQLAKGAVRAGIELLLERAGITYDEVEHVYLAGGMGFALKKEKAVAVGLFPVEFLDKITTVGNSALAGAITYSYGKTKPKELMEIVQRAEEITLASEDRFADLYMKYMFFA